MRAGSRELVTGLVGGTVAGGGFLALVYGVGFTLVTGLVLGVVAGGCAWYIARQLVSEDERAPSTGDLVERGRVQAAAFARIAARVPDAELRRRVEHVAQRLDELFAELARKPEHRAEAEEFVTDFLPRAYTMVEHYVSLSSRVREGDDRLAAAARTVNVVADAVKLTHRKLMDDELAEFAAASRTLEQEIRIMHPTIAVRKDTP